MGRREVGQRTEEHEEGVRRPQRLVLLFCRLLNSAEMTFRSRAGSELEAHHLRVYRMQTLFQFIHRIEEPSISESPRRRRERERFARKGQSRQKELGSTPSRRNLKRLLRKTSTMAMGILIVQAQLAEEMKEQAAVYCWEVITAQANTCLDEAARSIGSIQAMKHMQQSERLRSMRGRHE